MHHLTRMPCRRKAGSFALAVWCAHGEKFMVQRKVNGTRMHGCHIAAQPVSQSRPHGQRVAGIRVQGGERNARQSR